MRATEPLKQHGHGRVARIAAACARGALVAALAVSQLGAYAQERLSTKDRDAAREYESTVRKQTRMPTAKEQAQASAGIRLPSPAALGEAVAGGSVDVRELMEKYAPAGLDGDGKGNRGGQVGSRAVGQGAQEPLEGLVIFVSLNMPRASLQRLAADARRYKGTLLLRGLKNKSLVETARAIQDLQETQGEKGAAWRIDPRMFDHFRVEAVPAYVLLDTSSKVPGGCLAKECIGDLQYARIDGDITIDHALRSISTGVPALRGQADRLLAGARR